MTEEQSDHIEQWFCANCSALGCEIVYLPECIRDDCETPKRSTSKYCCEACGVKVARIRLHEIIPTLKKIPAAEPVTSTRHIMEKRIARKQLIRALEKTQLLVDSAIERHSKTDFCGYDFRITNEWQVDLNLDHYPLSADGMAPFVQDVDMQDALLIVESENINDELAFDSQKVDVIVSPGITLSDTTKETISIQREEVSVISEDNASTKVGSATTNELSSPLCQMQGRCPRHDGWQFIKSRELELLISEQVLLVLILDLSFSAMSLMGDI